MKFGEHERSVRVARGAALSSFVKHIADTNCAQKKEFITTVSVYLVIVFYLKTMNKRQGKNDQVVFRDQIFIKKNCKFSAQKRKTNEFLASTRPRSGFSMLESLFTRISGQKIA